MATELDNNLDELASVLLDEMQQVKDAIAAGKSAAELQKQIDNTNTRVRGFIDALKSDDATSAEPTPEAPPTPTE